MNEIQPLPLQVERSNVLTQKTSIRRITSKKSSRPQTGKLIDLVEKTTYLLIRKRDKRFPATLRLIDAPLVTRPSETTSHRLQ